MTLSIIFIKPCVMLSKRLFRLSLLLLTLSPLSLSFAGGDEGSEPVNDCKDIELILSNQRHPNPLKEELRPAYIGDRALNYKFYALLEGRADGTIPVYAWYKRNNGFVCVASYLQRVDFFDVCGRYTGSVCQPVPVLAENTDYVLVRRRVKFESICKELDKTPELKKKILSNLKDENLYGLRSYKGMNPDAAFLNKYTPYAYANLDRARNRLAKLNTPVEPDFQPKEENIYEEEIQSTPKENDRMLPGDYLPQLPDDALNDADVEEAEEDLAPEAVEPNEPDVEDERAEEAPPAPAAPKKKIDRDSLPTARAVPGKKGFVFSTDLNNTNAMIDVKDIPAGTIVKDPYNGEMFLVPAESAWKK